MREKGIDIQAQFNYLEGIEESEDILNGNSLDDDTLDSTVGNLLLAKHDETYFKRNDLATILIEHEFLKGRKELVHYLFSQINTGIL